MPGVALRSDYRDCYDIWFQPEEAGAVVFSRIAQQSWSLERKTMFDLFERLGIAHPKFGHPSDFRSEEEIVLYEDALAHCGEGKQLLEAGAVQRVIAADPSHIWATRTASAYVSDVPGMSYRMFVVAGHVSWFEHWSDDDWRSNCGDGDLGELSDEYGRILNLASIEAAVRPICNPVYAIDFVGRFRPEGLELQAIDFNPAPRLSGTPACDELKRRFGGQHAMAQAIVAGVLGISERLNERIVDNNRILLREDTA